MYKGNKKNVIELIADKYNVSSEKVREEIQITINDARNNPNPETQAYFTKLFGDKTPTPEEFIMIVSLEVMRIEKEKIGLYFKN